MTSIEEEIKKAKKDGGKILCQSSISTSNDLIKYIPIIKAELPELEELSFTSFNNIKFLPDDIEESNGEDIRVFVIGNKVVASIKRSSVEGEFRSNVHRGGKTESIKISQKEKYIALSPL